MTGAIDTDVLVAGLGPAGASAAAAAARAGARVLAVERNAVPGQPVQCAEFVPMMIGTEMPDVGTARVQGIEHMETYVGTDAPDVTPDFMGHMIDRERFDRHLIGEAMEAGVNCQFATPVRVNAQSKELTIDDGATVRAKAVIGAEGPRSPLGHAIGCANVELVETRQITVDLRVPHTGTDIFLRPEIVGGYGWLFPKGKLANLGLGVVPAYKSELKSLLDGLHAELVAAGRVGEIVHRHTGGLIPVGGMVGPVGRLGEMPVLLCGDAAGLTNPITGAGINAAVISGRAAGEAAAAILSGHTDAAKEYAEEMEDLFGASLALAVERRRKLLDIYARAGRPDDRELRNAWIAYPAYWSRDEKTLEVREIA